MFQSLDNNTNIHSMTLISSAPKASPFQSRYEKLVELFTRDGEGSEWMNCFSEDPDVIVGANDSDQELAILAEFKICEHAGKPFDKSKITDPDREISDATVDEMNLQPHLYRLLLQANMDPIATAATFKEIEKERGWGAENFLMNTNRSNRLYLDLINATLQPGNGTKLYAKLRKDHSWNVPPFTNGQSRALFLEDQLGMILLACKYDKKAASKELHTLKQTECWDKEKKLFKSERSVGKYPCAYALLDLLIDIELSDKNPANAYNENALRMPEVRNF